MAARRPLVIDTGQVQQLPTGDLVAYEQTVTAFTIADGQYAIAARMTITGANRGTLAGTARLALL
jgi:hypothetical protein